MTDAVLESYRRQGWPQLTEHNMGIDAAQLQQKPQQAIYAAQLLESLSDVVDTLNEALADGFRFTFQMSQTPDGKFALTTLNCTIPMIPQALVAHE